MKQRGREDRVGLLEDVVKRGRHPHQDGSRNHLARQMLHSVIHFYDKTHPHGLWILVSEQRKKRSEAAEAGREQDEEGQLLLRIHGDLVERGQQLSVSAL